MDTQTKPTLLIIDDATESLSMLSELLLPLYRVRVANSGEIGLRMAHSAPMLDLILLDVMMPVMDGFAVLAELRKNPCTQDIPVVFLTAKAEAQDVERGLQLGAADYITKPFSPIVVLARVRTQLEAKQARDWMKNQNAALEAEVRRRMAENDLTQRASIRALAHLAETRDLETGNHIRRTQGYVHQLALDLQHHPRFAATLTDHYIETLSRSAPLHDIGKVGIPDQILRKPGVLTPDEVTVMRTHAAAILGLEHLAQMAERLDRALRTHPGSCRVDDAFRANMEAIRLEITTLLAALPPPDLPPAPVTVLPLDPDSLQALLTEIDALLALGDAAVLGLFEAHAAELRTALGPPRSEELARQIKQFDFDAARVTLRKLLSN